MKFILTVNGGSSSIKYALFEAGAPLRRILEGRMERIGLPEATFRVKGLSPTDHFSRPVTAPDHTVAVGALMDWIEERLGPVALTVLGHRVVHGVHPLQCHRRRQRESTRALGSVVAGAVLVAAALAAAHFARHLSKPAYRLDYRDGRPRHVPTKNPPATLSLAAILVGAIEPPEVTNCGSNDSYGLRPCFQRGRRASGAAVRN